MSNKQMSAAIWNSKLCSELQILWSWNQLNQMSKGSEKSKMNIRKQKKPTYNYCTKRKLDLFKKSGHFWNVKSITMWVWNKT